VQGVTLPGVKGGPLRRAWLAIGVIGILLCTAESRLNAQRTALPDVDLDHVILGVASLGPGIEEFARLTGVVAMRGGQHPGRGTENALVSLGSGRYLEILAPIVPRPESMSRSGSTRLALTPAGWALHTRALDALIGRVRAAGFEVVGPIPGSRLTPDSTLLQWRTATATGAGLELAPFFIEWAVTTAHPSTTAPTGCRLVGLELTEPDPTRLRALFAAVGYHLEAHAGSPRAARLTLDCPRGRVTFAR
jgi:glyoxalase-like protein